MMKWLKLTLLFIFLIIIAYILNYWRLSSLPPKDLGHYDYTSNTEANTIHYYGWPPAKLNGGVNKDGSIWVEDSQQKKKVTVDLGNSMTVRLSDDPYMGTHYLSLWRMFTAGFNLKYPTGIVVYQQHIVALYYSIDDPKSNTLAVHYHWHKHNNVCYMEGMVATTAHSPLWCLSHGYVWFPYNKYMLHVWLFPNPNGQNDLYNSNYP